MSVVDRSNVDKVRKEFEQVKKEVDSIISKFKNTKLARILGIQSEMEGIEFSWNNQQQTLKILETFVDALLTAKARKTKSDENLIIKIVKEEKLQDTMVVDNVKRLANYQKINKAEKDAPIGEKQARTLDTIIKQAIDDYKQ